MHFVRPEPLTPSRLPEPLPGVAQGDGLGEVQMQGLRGPFWSKHWNNLALQCRIFCEKLKDRTTPQTKVGAREGGEGVSEWAKVSE